MATPNAFRGCRGNKRLAGEAPAYNDWSDTDRIFPSIDDHRFSDRVRDAPIEKWLLRHVPCVFIAVRLAGTALGTTNTGGRIKSERIAIADSACVFDADTVGTETIAEGRSGKRLCLAAGRASCQQHR